MRTAIIPHHCRPSVIRTLESLSETGLFDDVLVVSTDDDGVLSRASGARSRFRVISPPAGSYCKALFLNEGLRAVNEGFVLISDADVVWNRDGLAPLISPIDEGAIDFGWISHVSESDPTLAGAAAAGHSRASFRVSHDDDGPGVEILRAAETTGNRPGYGLIYGAAEAFRAVGGYKSWSGTWGWEDLDFIMRAELLGYRVGEGGSALHLSHDDGLRVLRGVSRTESRDQNIERSRAEIVQGLLIGPLGVGTEPELPPIKWVDLR